MKVPEDPYIAAMVASLDAHYPSERLAACDALLDCVSQGHTGIAARIGEVLLEVVKDRHISERERALVLLARLVIADGRGW